MLPRQVVRRTIRLHPKQLEFRRGSSLFRGFVGGRGSGKTWVGAYDLLRRAKRGHTYVATSPTYTKLDDEVIPTVKGVATDLGIWRNGLFRATPRPSVQLTTGATIRFRSTQEPDTLRGPNLSGFWMDEASLSEREAYLIAIGCLREAGEMGWLSATFTPKGKGHWTYTTFGAGMPDTQLVQCHTRANPFLPPQFAATITRQYGGESSLLARQELGGEFVSLEGAEWPAEYFPDSIWFDDWPSRLALRAIAVDPSKGKDARKGDYAALVMLGLDPDAVLWVDADLWRGQSAEYLAEASCAHCAAFRPEVFACEANQWLQLFAVLIRQAAQRYGLLTPVSELNNQVNKLVRIRRLGPYLAQGRIRVRNTPGGQLLVQQLQEFPESQHDDGPDALEMALRALEGLLGQSASTPGRVLG